MIHAYEINIGTAVGLFLCHRCGKEKISVLANSRYPGACYHRWTESPDRPGKQASAKQLSAIASTPDHHMIG